MNAVALDVEIPLEQLEDRITELAANINAATYRWLCLIGEFDRRGGHESWGLYTCAHWLNWKCGIALPAAREKVRVARALEKLTLIPEAFAKGQVSYSKVRAMTRVATPESEEYWLMIARHGTASHVENLVRKYRGVLRTQERETSLRQQARRSLCWYYDDEGFLIVRGRLPAEQGEMLIQALERAAETLDQDVSAETPDAETPPWPVPDAPAETPEPDDLYSARRADALELLSESFLAQGAETGSGGDRYQLMVHVDKGVLETGEPDGRCDYENGPCAPLDTVLRLGCDAGVVTLEQGESLNIGRKRRTIPTGMRRALKVRDRGCRFPGCHSRRFVDGHHIHHWAHGGETALDNLILLCRHHHRLVHEGGYEVHTEPDGDFRFRRANGEYVEPVPSLPAADADIPALNRAQGLHIDARTGESKWEGEIMDYDMAIMGVLQLDQPGTFNGPRGPD